MAAIEMRTVALPSEPVQAGKGNVGQIPANLSFLDLLAQFQQGNLTAVNTSALPTAQDQVKTEELPEGTVDLKEQMDQIESLLDSILQALTGMINTTSNPTLKEKIGSWIEKLSALQTEGIPINLTNKDTLRPFSSSFIQVMGEIEESGIALPNDVMEKCTQVKSFILSSMESAKASMESQAERPSRQQLNGFIPIQQLIQNESYRVLSNENEFTADPQALDTMGEQKSSPLLPAIPFTTAGFLRMNQVQPESSFQMIHRDHFLQDTTQLLMSKIKIAQIAGGSEARVTLYPENLGQLDVKISVHHGQMVAQFVAETMLGKDLLESNMAALRTSLQQQGIQLDKIEVYQASDAAYVSQQGNQQERSGTFKQNQKQREDRNVSAVEETGEHRVKEIEYGLDSSLHLPEKNIDFTA